MKNEASKKVLKKPASAKPKTVATRTKVSARPVKRPAPAKATPVKAAPAKTKLKEKEQDVAFLDMKLLTKKIEEVEEEYDLTANVLVRRRRFSTGILAMDMQWGGGMLPGMYTIAAVEKSGKSTILSTIFGQMIKQRVPICHFRDAEGTVGVDIDYTKALMGDINLGQILGGYNNQKDEDFFKPRIHVDQSIERTYGFIRSILDILPDKIYLPNQKRWAFVAPDTKEGAEQMSLIGDKSKILKVKTRSKTRLVAYTNSDLIGFLAIDTYAALVPDSVDASGERGGQLSQEASSFAASLPKIVSRIVKKGFVVLGAQQLRQNPMDPYNPWREPSGNALRQYSQVRDWITAVSPSTIKTTTPLWRKGEYPLNSLGVEDSVEPPRPNEKPDAKGKDYYQMIYLQNKKNKTSMPYGRVEMRIWTRDRGNKGRGIDPVFDVWQYLVHHDFASVFARRVTIEKFFGEKKPYFEKFKKIIIAEVYGTEEDHVNAWKEVDPKAKPVRIREWCFQDLRERTGCADDDETSMFVK